MDEIGGRGQIGIWWQGGMGGKDGDRVAHDFERYSSAK